MNIIDPDNPIPKYLQISGWIKDLIESGRYEKEVSCRRRWNSPGSAR